MTLQIRDFLSDERARNVAHADVYTWIVQRAYGVDCDVIVGHHIGFQRHGDIQTETEIPSADSLLFDQEIMAAAFGPVGATIIDTIVPMKPGHREEYVRQWITSYEKKNGCGRSAHTTEVA